MKNGILLAIFAVFISGIALADHEEGHKQGSDHQENSHHNASKNEHHEAKKEGGFNAGEMIMHHISDAHQIHIFTLDKGTPDVKDDYHFSIPLPIILWDNGLKIFSSSKFYHHMRDGEHGVEYVYGDYIMSHEKIYKADENGHLNVDHESDAVLNEQPLDLSITKSIFGLLLALFLTFWIFRSIARSYAKNGNSAPKGMAAVFEPLILFVRDDLAIPSIGKKRAYQFMPFLLTIFFFIWISNLMGLIPGFGFNVMGTLGVTIVLAGIVFIISTVVANKHFWGHTLNPSGVPLPIKFILVPIEFAGLFIRPAVLMVRLTANITAGHIIILAFTALIFIFGEKSDVAGYGVGLGSVAFMIFMFFIELLVAFLQAYVFTLLSAMYFGMAVEEGHH